MTSSPGSGNLDSLPSASGRPNNPGLRAPRPECSPLDAERALQDIADKLADVGLRAVRLDLLERAAIENALAIHGGNRTHAAKSLGIALRTLQRKLKTLAEPTGESADSGSDAVEVDAASVSAEPDA